MARLPTPVFWPGEYSGLYSPWDHKELDMTEWLLLLQCRRTGLDPWVWKIPWRRKWQTTPVFLSGKFHGKRSLAGYSPWGLKEWDTTEWLTHTHTVLFLFSMVLQDNKAKNGKQKIIRKFSCFWKLKIYELTYGVHMWKAENILCWVIIKM